MKITACFVDSNFRGQGIGKNLIALAERKAISLGTKHMYVESNEAISSVKFYESAGYTIKALLDDRDYWIPIFDTSITLGKYLVK